MILRRITRKAPAVPKPFTHPDGEYSATLKSIQDSVLYRQNVVKLTFLTTIGQISMYWELDNEIMSKFGQLAGIADLSDDTELSLEDFIGANVTLSINYSKITKIYSAEILFL